VQRVLPRGLSQTGTRAGVGSPGLSPRSILQRLITIQLKAKDGEVQEQLAEYTNDAWRVVSVSASGAGQETYRSFLVAVVLEKP
jgi:hypothetical protein